MQLKKENKNIFQAYFGKCFGHFALFGSKCYTLNLKSNKNHFKSIILPISFLKVSKKQ